MFFVATMTAHGDYREFCKLAIDPSLDLAVKRTVEVTLKEFPKLTTDNLAISVIDLTRSDTVRRADYRGDAHMKIERSFIGKRFEAEQLERL